MNLAYVVPRVIRHFLPERLVRFLLLRSIVIQPGLETNDPAAAVHQYLESLEEVGLGLQGKRVFVFGYGGRFDIGVGLLEAGAIHVALCDRYARPDHSHNAMLLSRHARYIVQNNGTPRPNPEHMTLIDGDVRDQLPPAPQEMYDIVISNSVYEHLEDARGITQALAAWTVAQGVHIHFVDLRDHFFRYPFEMLKYSERTWRRLLNPSSNHNRLRTWHYREIFEGLFSKVAILVRARDDRAFEQARPQIRPEFISGDPLQDAVTLIRIIAQGPRD